MVLLGPAQSPCKEVQAHVWGLWRGCAFLSITLSRRSSWHLGFQGEYEAALTIYDNHVSVHLHWVPLTAAAAFTSDRSLSPLVLPQPERMAGAGALALGKTQELYPNSACDRAFHKLCSPHACGQFGVCKVTGCSLCSQSF
jgi:hypothetical protein